MEHITLANARDLLWEYAPCAADGLKVPLSSATNEQKDYWRGKLNQVIERFLTMGKWRGCWVKATLPIYSGVITLPRQLQSCSGVNLSCGPRVIHSRFWQFSQAHPSCSCSNGVVPINDASQTFVVPSGNFKLKVVSVQADDGKKIVFIGGVDAAGNTIYSQEELTLDNGLPPTTNTEWSSLPLVQKGVTEGPVNLYAVAGLDETLIATYAPGEKVPAYKQYRILNVGENDTNAECLCKLAYVAVVADTDLIIPGVYGALKHGLKALTYEDTSDDRQDAEWMRAVNILNDDRHELDGEAQPSFRFDSDFGAGSIINVI